MVKPVPIENGHQVGLLVTSAISIFMAAASVGLRLLAKRINGRFSWDDYCIIAAVVCSHLVRSSTGTWTDVEE